MPRLPPSLIKRAWCVSPLLPLLLRTCRTLESAHHELRWLREHVLERAHGNGQLARLERYALLTLCQQRSRGVPLQYLLGSQPFGELDIICKAGVLIPRPETEAYTTHVVKLVHQDPTIADRRKLKVLDLCTGTGCIPLLLHHLLSPKFSALELLGVDISPKALKLAQDNLLHNVNAGILPNEALDQVSFAKADLLCEDGLAQALSYQRWDIVISNPPYISQAGFAKDTQRSVRNWEPRLALVPSPAGYQVSIPASHPEDIFYHRILAIAKGAKARIVVMEVGDLEQGARVVKLALEMGAWKEVEIWRDWPGECEEGEGEARDVDVGGTQVPVNGVGLGRSVVCRR